jgi:hypothetical protein
MVFIIRNSFCKIIQIYRVTQWLAVLTQEKKDDLADCFLQGLWYLKNNKLINIDSHYHIRISIIYCVELKNK